MRTLLSLSTCLFLFAGCQGRDTIVPAGEPSDEGVVAYDSVLARQVEADDYGMSPYVMAFLKAGPNRSQNEEEAAELQRAHLDNINRLAETGKLVLAGPFLDDGEIRGIYIFNVATLEEAEALTATDPAVKAGRLIMELHPWYGSAAVKLISDWHGRIAKPDP